MAPYRLLDAVAWNIRNPRTFPIPCSLRRWNLPVGAVVKLVFKLPEEREGGCEGERMFVQVDSVEKSLEVATVLYRGTLKNYPVVIQNLAYGDEVLFGPEHIIAIEE